MREGAYTPTLGMLRALVGADGADGLDAARCRLRGLSRIGGEPNAAGRTVIRSEIRRTVRSHRERGHEGR